MRLLESEVYRGKQIRIYVVYPGEWSLAQVPSLGVRIDGSVIEDETLLKGFSQIGEALAWGRAAVDRRLGRSRGAHLILTPSPV